MKCWPITFCGRGAALRQRAIVDEEMVVLVRLCSLPSTCCAWTAKDLRDCRWWSAASAWPGWWLIADRTSNSVRACRAPAKGL